MTSSTPVDSAGFEIVSARSWRRFVAALIDCLVPWSATLLLVGVVLPGGEPSQWNAFDRFIEHFNADSFTLWTPLITLTSLCHGWNLAFQCTMGRTPGKKLLGITIVNEENKVPDRSLMVLHCVLRLFSAALFFAGYFWAFADPERRTLHDRLAGVYAVTSFDASRGQDD
jgi:uncharacterized RDD family membrane protein YckC